MCEEERPIVGVAALCDPPLQWEIKCPTGNSKSTISGQFQRASKQSKNLILDTRRTKMEYEIIEKRVRIELKKRAEFKRVLLVDKFEKIVAFPK